MGNHGGDGIAPSRPQGQSRVPDRGPATAGLLNTVGIVANPDKPGAAEFVGRVREWLRRAGVDALLESATAALSGVEPGVPGDELAGQADAIIVLGGDGTLLQVARHAAGTGIPVLGINLGRLGFLTAVPDEEAESAVARLLAGDYALSPRRMLQCSVARGDERLFAGRALNDAVISSGAPARIVTLDVAVNDQALTRYVSDGLIVATPTGSTAHSMSAGGPIVVPDTEAIVMTPICAHALTNRPLVLPNRAEVSVRVATGDGGLMLTLDGQVGVALQSGDEVRVSGSEESIALVTFPETPYFEVLRRKLHWSGSAKDIGGAG